MLAEEHARPRHGQKLKVYNSGAEHPCTWLSSTSREIKMEG